MFTKKMVIAVTLLLSVLHSLAARDLRVNYQSKESAGKVDESSQRHEYEYNLGSKLGESLFRGCSILIGTIRAAGEPVKENDKMEAQDAAFYTGVDVTVEEWLWGEQTHRGPVFHLDQVSPPERRKYDNGPWSVRKGG